MELWIRSQDKECLTMVNHLYTNDNCEIRQQNDLILATYKSKERALEVLDEIQERIIELDKAVIYSHISEEDYLNVYQMPEE